MRNFYLLALVLLTAFSANGQKMKTAAADKYYQDYQFLAAAQAYERIIKSDTKNVAVMEKLVQCYTKLNDPVKTEFWLGKVLKNPKTEPRSYKAFATLLAANGKYEEASRWFDKSYQETQDQESLRWRNTYQNLQQFYSDSALYQISKVTFNSRYADFSPAFYQEGVVFSSARDNGKINKMKFDYNNTWFIDLYFVKDTLAKPVPFSEVLNSKYHEGPLSFTPDQKTVYFTRNNFMKKSFFSSDGVSKLKIYYAAVYNGRWGQIREFNLNNKEYSVGQPALASDHVMYFVSDMPGGFGGTDLYRTEKVNEEWQKPVNLGPEINTTGNEMFPYVDELGILYFASNGHPGLGGLDIFYTAVSGNELSPVRNVGYPVNTVRDDFGFIIRNNHGYFSSNRNGNTNNDDIYRFKINREHPVMEMARMQEEKAKEEKLALTDSQVGALALNGPQQKQGTEDQQVGSATESAASLLAESNKEENSPRQEDNAGLLTNDGSMPGEPAGSAGQKVSPTSQVLAGVAAGEVDPEDQKVIPSGQGLAGVQAGEADPQSQQGEQAGQQGKPVAGLQDNTEHNNAERIASSTLALQEKAGQADPEEENRNTFLPDDATTVPGKMTRLKALPKEFQTGSVGEVIELEIKYDLDKTTIRPDAADVLNSLVTYMKRNPDIKVELGAHTDIRGSDAYNERLSQGRAESVVEYLARHGIAQDRLVPVGFGEKDLAIVGALNEEEHQLNRRTTAKIFSNEALLMAYHESVTLPKLAAIRAKQQKEEEYRQAAAQAVMLAASQPGAAPDEAAAGATEKVTDNNTSFADAEVPQKESMSGGEPTRAGSPADANQASFTSVQAPEEQQASRSDAQGEADVSQKARMLAAAEDGVVTATPLRTQAPVNTQGIVREMLFWNPNATDPKTAAALAKKNADIFFIISNAFLSLEEAEAYQQEVVAQGAEARIIMPFSGSKMYRVAVADYTDIEEAERQLPAKKRTFGAHSWILGLNSKEFATRRMAPAGQVAAHLGGAPEQAAREEAGSATPAAMGAAVRTAELLTSANNLIAALEKRIATLETRLAAAEAGPTTARSKKMSPYAPKALFDKFMANNHHRASARLLAEVAPYAVENKTGRAYIVSGSFSTLGSANWYRKKMARMGGEAKIIMPNSENRLYLVTVADYASRTEGRQKLPLLKRTFGLYIWILNY